MRCKIKYQASDGTTSERAISDWHPSVYPGSVDAFCELRGDRRSFNVKRMTEVIDLAAGEVISDPWAFFGIAEVKNVDHERTSLDRLTWEVLPAIKSLKFFAITTRAFRKRERLKVTRFVQEVCDTSAFSLEDVEAWVEKLWCANMHDYYEGNSREYASLLMSIPPLLLDRCQEYAYWIARGSGRKPLTPHCIERLQSEFSSPAKVIKPQAPDAFD